MVFRSLSATLKTMFAADSPTSLGRLKPCPVACLLVSLSASSDLRIRAAVPCAMATPRTTPFSTSVNPCRATPSPSKPGPVWPPSLTSSAIEMFSPKRFVPSRPFRHERCSSSASPLKSAARKPIRSTTAEGSSITVYFPGGSSTGRAERSALPAATSANPRASKRAALV